MKKFSLTLPTLLLVAHSSKAELVPGGDFQMYKAGTGYSVTATFVPGTNSFARGVGDGIDLAGGSVTYSDESPFVAAGDGLPDIDLPGWAPLQSGNDLVDNGVAGTIGMNLFAAWGGDGRIQSAESLGIIQSGSVYTITAMAGGPDSGPIQGPLAFHLMANGVQLTPSEIVDPTLPNGSAFQMISRTYDAASIAGHFGAEMTIVLGVEDANDFANRVIFDDVSMEVEGSDSTLFSIAANGENPGNYDFKWGSKLGSLYDLVSSTDLSTAPDTWPVWEDQLDIPGTSVEVTLSNIPGGDDSKRFFALIEKKPAP
ncbi:MAG: hypothetical protein QNL33_01160 [Akkermansiaceae bacterium]|jgi:hypothetical protein